MSISEVPTNIAGLTLCELVIGNEAAYYRLGFKSVKDMGNYTRFHLPL